MPPTQTIATLGPGGVLTVEGTCSGTYEVECSSPIFYCRLRFISSHERALLLAARSASFAQTWNLRTFLARWLRGGFRFPAARRECNHARSREGVAVLTDR